MPRYELTSPDGKRFEITAPDGASQDEVLAYAQSQWKAPEAKPEDPGMLAAAGIGIGRGLDKLYQGIKQASMTVNAMNPRYRQGAEAELAAQKQTQQFRDEAYKPLEQQHPIATALGESAPMMALPMGVSLKAAAAIGAVPGLLEYGSGEDRLQRAAMGGVGSGIGHGIGKAIGAVASPGIKATAESDRLAQVAASQGIPLDAAQITGNQVLVNAKAALSRVPWTAGGQQAKDAAKQEAYNKAILKFIGSDAKAATPDVMADAYQAITAKMDSAANSVALTLDDTAVAQLAKVEKNFLRRLPTDQKAVIRSYLDDLTESIGQTGAIPGDVYNKTRSELGRIAFNTDNITIREGAKGMQKVLDDAFDRQAPAEAVSAMKEARAQYAKYQTIAQGLKKARSTDGNLPPKQMYAQAQQDIPGFERGAGGDFNDLVRAGRKFLPDPVPNSGTPERLLYQNLLTAGSMSGLGAAGGAIAGGDPISGAALGLAGFGLSKSAQGLLNSPLLAKYLRGERLTEAQKRMLAQAGGSMGLLGAAVAD